MIYFIEFKLKRTLGYRIYLKSFEHLFKDYRKQGTILRTHIVVIKPDL
jgi:hypothetical protein